jgi:hypothetical protein
VHADHWAEEMKWVKYFFKTHIEQWQLKAAAVSETLDMSLAMAEGLCTFASEQAVQYNVMHFYCKHLWQYVAECIALGAGDVVPPSA